MSQPGAHPLLSIVTSQRDRFRARCLAFNAAATDCSERNLEFIEIFLVRTQINELWVLHIELSILTEKEPRTLQASKLNCRKLISQQG